MNSKYLNFKSVSLKVFFTYLGVYFLALLFSYIYDIESMVSTVQYKYLIFWNMISICFGLPLTIIFDVMLMKFFGFYYVLLFSPVLTFLSLIQVLMLSKFNFMFSSSMLFLKKSGKNYFLKLFKNITFSSQYMLMMSSFPILPHFLGSYIIASSKIKKSFIFLNTFLGSFFYYIFLYLMIENV